MWAIAGVTESGEASGRDSVADVAGLIGRLGEQ